MPGDLTIVDNLLEGVPFSIIQKLDEHENTLWSDIVSGGTQESKDYYSRYLNDLSSRAKKYRRDSQYIEGALKLMEEIARGDHRSVAADRWANAEETVLSSLLTGLGSEYGKKGPKGLAAQAMIQTINKSMSLLSVGPFKRSSRLVMGMVIGGALGSLAGGPAGKEIGGSLGIMVYNNLDKVAKGVKHETLKLFDPIKKKGN